MTMHDATRGVDDERPSRSARRREALDVLALARALAELPPARLDQLLLPDTIRAELTELQRTPSHIAHKRELAHLAKLMRAQDAGAFDTARAALANEHAATAREAADLHRVEALRVALLADDGADALATFIDDHPDVDARRLRALVQRAQRERAANQPSRAQRELFRMLRDAANRASHSTTA